MTFTLKFGFVEVCWSSSFRLYIIDIINRMCDKVNYENIDHFFCLTGKFGHFAPSLDGTTFLINRNLLLVSTYVLYY